ncbi:hypothetical protein EDO6_02819 [Paenibacillus xylanexedens]|nr:hypothetical protein EDO6_02819 [Paenibacillus xylanexedens]
MWLSFIFENDVKNHESFYAFSELEVTKRHKMTPEHPVFVQDRHRYYGAHSV